MFSTQIVGGEIGDLLAAVPVGITVFVDRHGKVPSEVRGKGGLDRCLSVSSHLLDSNRGVEHRRPWLVLVENGVIWSPARPYPT